MNRVMGGLKAASPMAPQDQWGHRHSRGQQDGAGSCRPLSSEWPGSSKPHVPGIWLQAQTHLSLGIHPPGSLSPSSSTRCSEGPTGKLNLPLDPLQGWVTHGNLPVPTEVLQNKEVKKDRPSLQPAREMENTPCGLWLLSSYGSFWHSSASYCLQCLFPWAVDWGWCPCSPTMCGAPPAPPAPRLWHR